MSQVYADFTLMNLFTKQRVSIRALVDTGTTQPCITSEVARTLGFDPTEVSTKPVTLADGRTVDAPYLEGVRIEFRDRSTASGLLVLGNECLMGVIPMEAMDLLVDPLSGALIAAKRRRCHVMPLHPDGDPDS